MDVFYNELKACKINGMTEALIKCNWTAASGTDIQSKENALKCVYSYRRCDPDLEYFLSLEDVAGLPQMVKGNLYDYIKSLNDGSKSSFNFIVLSMALLSMAFLNRFYL